MQPSMSKAELLLACQWWAGGNVPKPYEEVGEPARYGSAFHEVMAARVAGFPDPDVSKWGIPDPTSLVAHVEKARGVLLTWLHGDNPYSINFEPYRAFIEQAYAYNVEKNTARIVGPPNEHHVYACEPHEFPGTADLVCAPSTRPPKSTKRGLSTLERAAIRAAQGSVLVLDYKTGAEHDAFRTPSSMPQLMSLALAATKIHGTSGAYLAILHAPRGDEDDPFSGEPLIWSEHVGPKQLQNFRGRLRDAWRRIGDGSMRPNGHCTYCPALTLCPAWSGGMGALATTKVSRMTTASDVGKMHQQLAVYDRLRDLLRDEMKAWVKQYGPAERPDGMLVDIVKKATTNLSQASIKRALGEVKGLAELRRLEKLGCVEHGERDELRAVKE